MTTRHKTISEMLSERRDSLDHSQVRAADEIGVSRQIYSQWESGHATPGDQWIKPISIYLEVDEEGLALQRYYEKRDKAMPGYRPPLTPVTDIRSERRRRRQSMRVSGWVEGPKPGEAQPLAPTGTDNS